MNVVDDLINHWSLNGWHPCLVNRAKCGGEKHAQKMLVFRLSCPPCRFYPATCHSRRTRRGKQTDCRKNPLGDGWISYNQRRDVQPLDIWLHKPCRQRYRGALTFRTCYTQDRSSDRKYNVVITIETKDYLPHNDFTCSISTSYFSQNKCNLSFQTQPCEVRILYGLQMMLSIKSSYLDSLRVQRSETQQKIEKRCIWRGACVFVDWTARHGEQCQCSSAHLSHQGMFAAGPLRQHLLGWMILVESGPQRPDGWLVGPQRKKELGERDLTVRDDVQRLCVLVLLLVWLRSNPWTSSNRTGEQSAALGNHSLLSKTSQEGKGGCASLFP